MKRIASIFLNLALLLWLAGFCAVAAAASTVTRYYPPGGFTTDLSGFDYTQGVPGSWGTGHDGAGNVLHVIETYAGQPTREVFNTYDAVNRLITERDIENSQEKLTSYVYDRSNNRAEKTVKEPAGSPLTSRSVIGNPLTGNNANQLYGILKTDQVSTGNLPFDPTRFKVLYTYDADGNRATRITDPATAAAKTEILPLNK